MARATQHATRRGSSWLEGSSAAQGASRRRRLWRPAQSAIQPTSTRSAQLQWQWQR